MAVDRTRPISERMALSVMNRYTPEQVKWHYEHGLILQSIYFLGEKTGSPDFCGWVKTMYDTKVTGSGVIAGYREDEYNLDQINPGKVLFCLYKQFGEEKYRTAIELLRSQLRHQPRTKTNGFWHKKIYPFQMWLDGLYMQGPFYARYISEFGVPEDLDDVIHQFVLIDSKARDEKTGLLYHAWDESRRQLWANPETGCSPHFWGRAMGWYCMALVDTLDFIPPSHQKQGERLKTIANRLAVPILKYQDKENGLWYQVMDRGQWEKNYPETSASSMFVYFLLKMIRIGAVPKMDIPLIKDAALKGYTGLTEQMMKEDDNGELHLRGICKVAGLGGNPYRDGSYEYYVNEPVAVDDFKGVGPFILASLERENCSR